MATVEVEAAAELLSALVDQAAAGEEVVFARAGTPVARLVAVERPSTEPRVQRRILGGLGGRSAVPDDFDTMFQQEIIDMFEGR